jgi:hypothetical protein
MIDQVLKPRGVAVVIEATHQCMTTRGVHSDRSGHGDEPDAGSVPGSPGDTPGISRRNRAAARIRPERMRRLTR